MAGRPRLLTFSRHCSRACLFCCFGFKTSCCCTALKFSSIEPYGAVNGCCEALQLTSASFRCSSGAVSTGRSGTSSHSPSSSSLLLKSSSLPDSTSCTTGGSAVPLYSIVNCTRRALLGLEFDTVSFQVVTSVIGKQVRASCSCRLATAQGPTVRSAPSNKLMTKCKLQSGKHTPKSFKCSEHVEKEGP